MSLDKPYTDIPGTTIFDADMSRQGYHLNQFCMSLMKAENRKAFKENEARYLDRFALTPQQREAILKRQFGLVFVDRARQRSRGRVRHSGLRDQQPLQPDGIEIVIGDRGRRGQHALCQRLLRNSRISSRQRF